MNLEIPADLDEKEVIDTIDRIVNIITKKMKLGYLVDDDVKQELRIHALRALPKYDRERPLENFLMFHLSRRKRNVSRDKYMRSGPAPEDPTKLKAWEEHNESKRNLMKAGSGIPFDDSLELDFDLENRTISREFVEFLDANLPLAMRADYLKFMSGITLPKNKRAKLVEKLKEIWFKYEST